MAAALTYPHIVPLHDLGEADGFLYFVMPYIEGESLRDRIARQGPRLVVRFDDPGKAVQYTPSLHGNTLRLLQTAKL